MRAAQHVRVRGFRHRPGFTLIEILVVLAIIGVLAALTVGTIKGVADGQKKSSTEQTLRKVDSSLKQQYEAVVKQAGTEVPPPGIVNMAGGDPRRAQVIWVKLRLKQEFPQSYAEGKNAIVGPAKYPFTLQPLYATALSKVAAGSGGNTESAACLLLALQRVRSGAKLNPDDLGSGAVKDTNNDGLKEIVDDWGLPVKFVRWPAPTAPYVASGELDDLLTNANPNASKRPDPLDPEGLLLNPLWNNGQDYSQQLGVYWFEQLLHPVRVYGNNLYPHYLIPVIYSAGRNGVYDDNDDVLSFRLRTGARGD